MTTNQIKLKKVKKDGIDMGIVVEEDSEGYALSYRLLWWIKDRRLKSFQAAESYDDFNKIETYYPNDDFYEWCDEQGITWYRGEA